MTHFKASVWSTVCSPPEPLYCGSGDTAENESLLHSDLSWSLHSLKFCPTIGQFHAWLQTRCTDLIHLLRWCIASQWSEVSPSQCCQQPLYIRTKQSHRFDPDRMWSLRPRASECDQSAASADTVQKDSFTASDWEHRIIHWCSDSYWDLFQRQGPTAVYISLKWGHFSLAQTVYWDLW